MFRTAGAEIVFAPCFNANERVLVLEANPFNTNSEQTRTIDVINRNRTLDRNPRIR